MHPTGWALHVEVVFEPHLAGANPAWAQETHGLRCPRLVDAGDARRAREVSRASSCCSWRWWPRRCVGKVL
eukprot:11671096-Alexandrium_andersonii.AAC.1